MKIVVIGHGQKHMLKQTNRQRIDIILDMCAIYQLKCIPPLITLCICKNQSARIRKYILFLS